MKTKILADFQICISVPLNIGLREFRSWREYRLRPMLLHSVNTSLHLLLTTT